MLIELVLLMALAFFTYALISGRLEGSMLTAPLIFVVIGYAIGIGGLSVIEMDSSHSALHVVAELTLILVLFSDAARIRLKSVRADHNLPLRMLLIGLPLTMLLGTFAGQAMFPAFTLWEAALLAALLAPTDAALGQTVVSASIVPVRIRQAINIESGLNDGIALPAVLLFAALAAAEQDTTGAGGWLTFGLKQVILGPITGIAIGWLGSKLLDRAATSGMATQAFQGIAILSLAILCFTAAELIGGNGFIAAFIGGMAFGNTLRHECEFLYEFMETEGQLFMLITFLMFGAVLLPEGLENFEWTYLAYAAISLTVIRMLPVALSLLGSGVSSPTWLFLGWFGPRGLASILFVLLILEEADLGQAQAVLSITVVTVALSVLLHGLSAAPFANAYGRRSQRMGDCAETKVVSDIPLRNGKTKAVDS